MEITLISLNSPFLIDELTFPNLGALSLSSYLKQYNVDVKVVDLAIEKRLPAIATEIVGISTTTPQYKQALEIKDILKKRGHKTVLGGVHVMYTAEKCLKDGFDAVIRGEGEKALYSWLSNPVYHCSLSVEQIENIDTLPFPDRDAIDISKYHYTIAGLKSGHIMTSRGCPFHCIYCSSHWGRKIRFRSPENVYEEIKLLKEKYGFGAIMIFDDIFAINKKRIRKIHNLVKPLGMKYRAFSRTDSCDRETLELLKDMDMVELGIGLESGSDEILFKNNKGTTVEKNRKFLDMCNDVGIRVKGFFIAGLPGETKKTIQETYDFIANSKLADFDITVFSPYPGSQVWQYPYGFDIKFNKRQFSDFYKGIPGQYKCSVSTNDLTSDEILFWRDKIESDLKS